MIYVRELALPSVDRAEAMSYMGVCHPSESDERLLSRAEDELLAELTPRVCYRELPLSVDGSTVRLGDAVCRSEDLARRLRGADSAIVFVATVGTSPDRLIGRYSRLSPSVALAVSALGSERVEALCDELCATVCDGLGEGVSLLPRFSPGYGDLSLDFQREIFRLLSPERNIGVTLGERLLMSPTKSVSAIIGIKRGEVL